MPKPIKFTRGRKFQEQEGDYDPEQWRRRDPNVSELASGSDKSRIPGQGGFSPEGPVGDLDAVPFESSQIKALHGLEYELESIQKSAANLDVSLVDQPMTVSRSPQPIKSSGIPEVDKIREQTAQIDFDYETQSASRSGGGGTKLTTNPDFFKEDGSAKTYREFYEEKINEKVGQIEVEKALMGQSYEQQALKQTASDRMASIGEALDEVDLELATGDVSNIKSTTKNAPSIANPNQMSTNPGFRGEVHSVSETIHGRKNNPINRPPQVTSARDADPKWDPKAQGYTGLEPEGYSPMNPTVEGSGETPQQAKRRVAAAQRKAATKKIKGKTVYTGETKGFVPPAGMNDDITDAQEAARSQDLTDAQKIARDNAENAIESWDTPDLPDDGPGASVDKINEYNLKSGHSDFKSQVPAAAQPTAKEIPTVDVGGVDVNDINYKKTLNKALASGLDAVTSAVIASKAYHAGKAGLKSVGKKLPMLGLGLITEDMLKKAGVYKKDWSS
jgi:hypothetical protein